MFCSVQAAVGSPAPREARSPVTSPILRAADSSTEAVVGLKEGPELSSSSTAVLGGKWSYAV